MDDDPAEVPPEVPPELVGAVRAICLGLPETVEEPAWVGVRWRVRRRTFAHVLWVDRGSPPLLARIAEATGTEGPVVVFRSSGPELDALRHQGPPFFYAGWGRDAVGVLLSEQTDWVEVAELLTESWCTVAPKRLHALVVRPDERRPPPPTPASE